jgi:hypothetical protein
MLRERTVPARSRAECVKLQIHPGAEKTKGPTSSQSWLANACGQTRDLHSNSILNTVRHGSIDVGPDIILIPGGCLDVPCGDRCRCTSTM